MSGVNRRRGEAGIELDGKPYRLRLTLNALAELEDAFAAENLSELVARFGSGKLSARDMLRVLGAGLRGAGAEVSDAELGAMATPKGAAGFAEAVGELLTATFGGAAGAGEGPRP